MQKMDRLWPLLEQRPSIREVYFGSSICTYLSECEAKAIQRVLAGDPTRCRELLRHVADLLRYYKKWGVRQIVMCMHSKDPM